MDEMSLKSKKLNRWLNIRKITLKKLNFDLKHLLNSKISLSNCDELSVYSIEQVAKYLDVPLEKLIKKNHSPIYIFKTKEQILNTKRKIFKDNIHFYNYYTLPTPSGYVSPVLLDILCSKKKLPKLNNGHLEPAITISMGPNDIYARFGERINKDTFIKFKINKNKKNDWIVGSSYFEPSFCKHSYSRSENGLGRIISYTTKSFIENLTEEKLNDQSYLNLLKSLKNSYSNRSLLKFEIENKGYSLSDISKKIKLPIKKINKYFDNKKFNLEKKYLKKICDYIKSDYRLFVDKKFNEDSVGKLYFDYKDSIKTIRKFKSYTVASIVNSKRYPDLSGLFIKVSNNKKNKNLDLMDSKCSHYYVTGGNVNFFVKDKKKIQKINAKEDDCFWVSAFSEHGFSGNGSLVKISDGQNINYLEKEDITNTYQIKDVLKRARADIKNWGYDE